MKVECKAKPGKRGLWTIFVDEDEWKEVHRYIFGPKPKIPASLRSLTALEEWFQINELAGAKRYALFRLSRKSQPSSEMRKALKQALVSEAVIDAVIGECRSLGYLDDKEWVERFVKVKSERKMGPLMIAAKLRSKGLKDDEISAALRQNDISETDAIKSLIKQRFAKLDLSDFNTRRKVFGSLARKGFHPQAIQEVLECKD